MDISLAYTVESQETPVYKEVVYNKTRGYCKYCCKKLTLEEMVITAKRQDRFFCVGNVAANIQKVFSKDISLDHKSPGYRKEILKMAGTLKKKGMTHNKIAKTFNDGKIPTVSGTGKWYASSIANLLHSKR